MKTTTVIHPQWIEACLADVYAPSMIKRLTPELSKAIAKELLKKYPPGKIRQMATKQAIKLQAEDRKAIPET